jgi:SAM-dependent methyltransferase
MYGDKKMKTQQQITEYYNRYVERQKPVGINDRHRSIVNRAILSGLKANDNVLEIGCGIGTVTELLINYLKNGYLYSCDLSPDSIQTAKDRLKEYKNLEIYVQDATDFCLDRKFNVIIMPDVIEDIPIDLHARMFKNLSKMLCQNGFIYIHIPSPYYLDWCRLYRPDILQILDQSIYLDLFVRNIADTDLYLHSEEPYNIWMEPYGGGGERVHSSYIKKKAMLYRRFLYSGCCYSRKTSVNKEKIFCKNIPCFVSGKIMERKTKTLF